MSLIGQTIGNYRVTRQLGEGGMGVVYEAEHPVIGRKVAIKLLHLALARDPEVVARFFNEARAIHTVGHENIVEILDFGQTADAQPYFIMEFLSGEAMNERIARGAIPPAEAAEIADQICRALGAAHDKGIVHRDLKPHNVQLLPTPAGGILVKLLDFGVAKIMNTADLSQSVKTRTGSLMGTPIYMSPEQCKGAGEIDHRTDIYSLGVLLYEMLAGRPPFVAGGVGELFALHMLQAPPPVTDFAPRTPPAMAAAVMRSLAKEPRDRFPSMDDLRRAFLADGIAPPIRAAAGRTLGYRPPPGPTLTMPTTNAATTLSASPRALEDDVAPVRRGRTGLLIAALGVAAAGAATYVFVVQSGQGAGPGAGRAPAAEVEAIAPEPAAAAAVSRTVTIRFESEPAGAQVARVTDDKNLGVVPFELKLPRAGGKPEYRFRLEGYRDQTLAVDLASDQTLRATLEKVAAPPAPTALGEPPAHAEAPTRPSPPGSPSSLPHRPRRPARNAPLDDDGLATPKF